jgi:hypothetical protein
LLSVVAVPPASLTLCDPCVTVCSPVVPPSPASVFLTVPSIERLNFPGSLAGERLFATSSFPVVSALLNVHSASFAVVPCETVAVAVLPENVHVPVPPALPLELIPRPEPETNA